MTPAAQPLTADAGPLSPWWMRAVVVCLGVRGSPAPVEQRDGSPLLAARVAIPAVPN